MLSGNAAKCQEQNNQFKREPFDVKFLKDPYQKYLFGEKENSCKIFFCVKIVKGMCVKYLQKCPVDWFILAQIVI